MPESANVTRVRTLTGCPEDVFSEADIETFLDEANDRVYVACANLLDAWAARVSVQVSFTADGTTMNLSDQAVALREAAKVFRRRSAIRVVAINRADERP